MLIISDSDVIEHDWTMKVWKMPRLWRNSFFLHNFDILSVILWAIENKPSRGFALTALLTSNWYYFWLLILIANRTTWLNTKLMADGNFQSRPKFNIIDTIKIVQASTTCLDNNTADYYQFWWEDSDIRSRWV